MPVDDPMDYFYPLDLTGEAPSNKVVNERQTLNPPETPTSEADQFHFHFILPRSGPYYRDSMKIIHITTGQELIRGVHWAPGHKFHSATRETANRRGGIYASILLYDVALAGEIELREYQVLGDNWGLDENKILEILSNRLVDPRIVTYEQVSGKPEVFPPQPHPHPGDDLTGLAEVVLSNLEIATAIREGHSQLPDLVAALLLAVKDQEPKYLGAVVIQPGAYVDFNLKQIIPNWSSYDLLGARVEARVRDIDNSSPTFNMYIDALEVVTTGINANGLVRVHNYFTSPLEFLVRIDVARNM